MLGNKEAAATIAVKDLVAAKKFYEGTLGLKLMSTQGEEALNFKSGGSTVVVYRSQFAGTNKATVVGWSVGAEIEKIVAGLRERGVPFLHYDLPAMTRNGDLHVAGDFKAAWFTDPEGNILALTNE
jgi:catechol 2,3-dioxygenase-like lactoylglutathione lyase family enzyme